MAVKKLRRVLLVTPPYHCGMVESAGVWMPLGLAYLAGSLRRAGLRPGDLRRHVAVPRHGADKAAAGGQHVRTSVAVTAYTATLPAAAAVLRAAKEDCPGVGHRHRRCAPHPHGREVLADQSIDYVVRGEGELSVPRAARLPARRREAGARRRRLVSRRRRRRRHARPAVREPTWTTLPVAWDLIDWPTYHYRTKPGSRLAIASWARGCPEACSFCSQQKLWRRTWRPRSVEAVVAEARMLRERFGVDTLEVADEYPTRDRDRWERILDRLIEEDLGIELLVETRADDVVRDAGIIGKYRDAGILHLYVGVESVRQETARRHAQAAPRRGLPARHRAAQRGRHHHRDVLPLRLPRRHAGDRRGDAAAVVRVRTRPGLLPGGDAVAVRGLVRRRSPTASRSPTTPSTTSSTPSSARTA